MQERLFSEEATVEFDENHDPYAEWREQAKRIAADYDISVEEALDMIVARGSESSARRALDQRWWFEDDAEAA